MKNQIDGRVTRVLVDLPEGEDIVQVDYVGKITLPIDGIAETRRMGLSPSPNTGRNILGSIDSQENIPGPSQSSSSDAEAKTGAIRVSATARQESTIFERPYPPRRMMRLLAKSDFDKYANEPDYAKIVVDGMYHSLRFWLAHKYSSALVEGDRRHAKICRHFGVEEKMIRRAKKNNDRPETCRWLTPGENNLKSKLSVIDRYGTEECRDMWLKTDKK